MLEKEKRKGMKWPRGTFLVCGGGGGKGGHIKKASPWGVILSPTATGKRGSFGKTSPPRGHTTYYYEKRKGEGGRRLGKLLRSLIHITQIGGRIVPPLFFKKKGKRAGHGHHVARSLEVCFCMSKGKKKPVAWWKMRIFFSC